MLHGIRMYIPYEECNKVYDSVHMPKAMSMTKEVTMTTSETATKTATNMFST